MSLAPPRSPALVVLVAALLAALAASVVVATARLRARDGLQPDAAPGGFGKLTFRVPNESDTASTVGAAHPDPGGGRAGLAARPAGARLDGDADHLRPRRAARGPRPGDHHLRLGRRVPGRRRRRHRARASSRSSPSPAGRSRTPTSSSFPTVQLYSDGTEAAWIEPTVDGQRARAAPRPVLTLAASTASADATTAADRRGRPSTRTPTPSRSRRARLALFLAILALLAGIAGVVLGWRASRRTVSS